MPAQNSYNNFLAIDIGNTNIVCGFFIQNSYEKPTLKFRLESNINKPINDLAIDIAEQILLQKINIATIDKILCASVVPELSRKVEEAFKIICQDSKTPFLLFRRDFTTKTKILLPNPEEVGDDRLINAAFGYKKHGGNLLIIDFGTATTFDLIGNDGEYLGGIIAPGINLAVKTLHEMTAKLPKITIQKQKNVIGKSTKEALNSGIYHGYISMIEGLIAKIEKEYGQKLKIIFTGGLATIYRNSIQPLPLLEENLTLTGIADTALWYNTKTHL